MDPMSKINIDQSSEKKIKKKIKKFLKESWLACCTLDDEAFSM